MRRDRTIRTMLGIAVLFAILGAGNVYFGRSKLDHYSNLLSAATSELATSSVQTQTGIPGIEVNIDRQTVFVNRLRARVGFYTLVVLGGQCFLALSGITLLAVLVRKRIIDAMEDATSVREDATSIREGSHGVPEKTP